jgi:glycosyltransferase involved in cell wall biosynthesis
MQLAINGRFLTQSTTGVQRYAIELVSAIDRIIGTGGMKSDCLSLRLLTPRGPKLKLNLRHIPVLEVGRFGGHLWEQLELPFYTRGDLLLNLCNSGPLLQRNQVVTIHDAAIFATPSSFSRAFRAWYKFLLPHLGGIARRVITDSHHSKRELMRFCGLAEDRIEVIYLGSDQALRYAADNTVLDRNDLAGKPYIFAVSSQDERKNFSGLAEAIELLGTQDFKVVIAGGANPRVFRTSEVDHVKHVKFLGYVNNNELRALYEHAACFVYPSLYEGFGLPPLEAMACGCPVIVSNATSLPEVCGEAALYCDPNNPSDIADKIQQLMRHPELGDELRARGFERAREFSWDKCARESLAVFDQFLSA